MRSDELLYPVFLECCSFTNDAYWMSIFNDLAYGRAPYGAYISKGFLCCNYKGKGFSYKIEKKPADILFGEVYTLFTGRMGLMSYTETESKKKEFYSTPDSKSQWASIRKKYSKDVLLEKYVIDLKHKHSLSLHDAKSLLSIICIALLFKTISTMDIEFAEGKISHIDGITITNDGKPNTDKLFKYKEGAVAINIIQSEQMSEYWGKYMKKLNKYIQV